MNAGRLEAVHSDVAQGLREVELESLGVRVAADG